MISRYLVAVVFIFSGFVKCVDPTGTAIKMEEYFVVFGISFLIPLSMTFSILMCGVELLVGLLLLFNIRIVWGIWGALALMVFYTPLTLWLAITNKVTDCGCFGDAIILNNAQTFIKNVVIDLFIIVLVIERKHFPAGITRMKQWIAALAMTALVFGFEFYNLMNLPLIDFMPYKVGTNIPASMIIPEGAPQEIRKFVFYYEKDGVRKGFDMNSLPDSTWSFVDRKEGKLIQKGYVPPIHDFMITTPDNMDLTSEILANSGKTYLLIIGGMNKSNTTNFDEVNRIAEQAIAQGHDFIAVTSSLPEEYEQFRQKVKATYPIYMMDGTTIKTMIRSNPGIMLIKNGTILGKWHHRKFKRIIIE